MLRPRLWAAVPRQTWSAYSAGPTAGTAKWWDDPHMADDAGTAQAHVLLRELYEHVSDLSQRLEAADERNRRARRRGTVGRDLTASALRREFYEAHRLIDALHRRFPDTHTARPQGTEQSGLHASRLDRIES